MADTMTQQQRHYCMSRIGGRDTKPEMIVRRCLWRHGYRYRLCDKRLPGRPDVVLHKWRTVIFVNGCFWHGHDCDKFRLPATNAEFWRTKIERNRRRDAHNVALLTRMGYQVIVVWECQLSKARKAETLESLLYTLSGIILRRSGQKAYPSMDNSSSMAAEPER